MRVCSAAHMCRGVDARSEHDQLGDGVPCRLVYMSLPASLAYPRAEIRAKCSEYGQFGHRASSTLPSQKRQYQWLRQRDETKASIRRR